MTGVGVRGSECVEGTATYSSNEADSYWFEAVRSWRHTSHELSSTHTRLRNYRREKPNEKLQETTSNRTIQENPLSNQISLSQQKKVTSALQKQCSLLLNLMFVRAVTRIWSQCSLWSALSLNQSKLKPESLWCDLSLKPFSVKCPEEQQIISIEKSINQWLNQNWTMNWNMFEPWIKARTTDLNWDKKNRTDKLEPQTKPGTGSNKN